MPAFRFHQSLISMGEAYKVSPIFMLPPINETQKFQKRGKQSFPLFHTVFDNFFVQQTTGHCIGISGPYTAFLRDTPE